MPLSSYCMKMKRRGQKIACHASSIKEREGERCTTSVNRETFCDSEFEMRNEHLSVASSYSISGWIEIFFILNDALLPCLIHPWYRLEDKLIACKNDGNKDQKITSKEQLDNQTNTRSMNET